MSSLNTIGLRSNGQVAVWGYSGSIFSNVPPDLTNVIAVAAGQNYFLTLKSDGSVVAWGGTSSYGQTNVPAMLTNVISIDAFNLHSLALTSEGKVIAWGLNSYGQTNVPANLSNVVAVAAGSLISAALKSDGNAVVWGTTTGNPHTIPAAATNLVMIDAGVSIVTALRDDGAVLVWGGVTTPSPINLPTGLANVTAISAGEYFDLALVEEEQNQPAITFSQPTYSSKGFEVTVPTRSGRVYRLEHKNSLSDASWIALPLVAGTGNARLLTDPSATNVQQRFYRVRQW
jgi:alpha-tubulin suppressor-like RCC1 family protein